MASTKITKLDQALSTLVDTINKKSNEDYKYTAATRGNDERWADIKYHISTGCVPIDVLTWGGMPGGRITEIFGHHSHGKSSTLDGIILGCQRQGGFVILLLSEGSLDTARMVRQGIDLDRLVIVEIESLEEGMHYINTLVEQVKEDKGLTGVPVLMAWDTISNSQEEEVRKSGDPTVSGIASKARQIRRFMRNVNTPATRLGITMIFLTQTHASFERYGPGFDTDGGWGLKFNTSMRIHVRRVRKVFDDEMDYQDIGIVSKFIIDKSKCGPPPFRSVEYRINAHSGIDNDTSMCDFLSSVPAIDDKGKEMGAGKKLLHVVEVGSWYKLHGFGDGTPLSFRYSQLKKFLDEHPGVRQYMADSCIRACPRVIARPILEPEIVAQEDPNEPK